MKRKRTWILSCIFHCFCSQDSIDETEDDSSSDEDEDGDLASENATAVTRFLIKTFPKQLSKLRNEKTELEERVQVRTIINFNENICLLLLIL